MFINFNYWDYYYSKNCHKFLSKKYWASLMDVYTNAQVIPKVDIVEI